MEAGCPARPPSRGKDKFVLRSELRCLRSVAAGLALAGDEDGGGGAGTPARTVGEGVQNAGYDGVGREDSHEYDRDRSERHDESND
jgi:hypothetical protein